MEESCEKTKVLLDGKPMYIVIRVPKEKVHPYDENTCLVELGKVKTVMRLIYGAILHPDKAVMLDGEDDCEDEEEEED